MRGYLSYLPQNWAEPPPVAQARPPKPADLRALVPESERGVRHAALHGLVDEEPSLRDPGLPWQRRSASAAASTRP